MEGQTPTVVACENRDRGAGFIAMKEVKNVNTETVKKFLSRYIETGQRVKTNKFKDLNNADETQEHEAE